MATALSKRIAVAAVAIPLVIAMVYQGGWVLVVGLGVLGVVGTHEFFKLAEKGGASPLLGPGILGAALLPVTGYLVVSEAIALSVEGAAMAGAGWMVVTMAYAVVRLKPGQSPISSIAVTLFGPLYAAGMPTFLFAIRHGVNDRVLGTLLVFWPLVTTWFCDTTAMSGGAIFGGPKLAPTVSPNKTWSGAFSGLAGAVVIAVVYGVVAFRSFDLSLKIWQLMMIGLVVGIGGQVGDLAESLFKRSVDVKDSGTFFLEHGGVLDRLDSLYWVLPLSAMLLYAWGVV